MTERPATASPVPPDRAAALLLALAAAVYLACAHGGLWFDEVWTARFTAHGTSLAGILGEKHDNNHLLNSLWFHLVGPYRAPLLYRLPSLLAGLATVALAGLLASPFGRPARLTAMALTALSFPLVNYFTEARGYGPAVACALGALWLLIKSAEAQTRRRVAGFWLVAALGLLSHLTFAAALLALAPPALFLALSKTYPRFRPRHLAFLFSAPLALAAALYLGFVSGMERGGGAMDTWFGAWEGLAALNLGLRGNDLGATARHISALTMVGLAALAVLHHLRRDPFWAALAASALLLPPLLALASGGEGFAPRYYLAAQPFLLVALAAPLARALTSPTRSRRYGATLLLAALLGGNAVSIAALAARGRGDYSELAREMLKLGKGTVSVVGDQESRHYIMLDYALRSLGAGDSLRYRHGPDALLVNSSGSHNTLDLAQLPSDEPRQPRFLLTQSFWKTVELETMETPYGRYRHLGSYLYYGGPSGWNTYLYAAEGDRLTPANRTP